MTQSKDWTIGQEPIIGWYAGLKRSLYRRICEQCRGEYLIPKHLKSRFCSEICHNMYQSRHRIDVVCAQCGISFKKSPTVLKRAKSGLNFCSRKCKDKAQRIGGLVEIQPPHYGTGFDRGRLIAERGHRCEGEDCGVTEWRGQPVTLEVHHVDGDRKNNSDGNLQLLCGNCHAMTPNWRWRNWKNKGDEHEQR